MDQIKVPAKALSLIWHIAIFYHGLGLSAGSRLSGNCSTGDYKNVKIMCGANTG